MEDQCIRIINHHLSIALRTYLCCDIYQSDGYFTLFLSILLALSSQCMQNMQGSCITAVKKRNLRSSEKKGRERREVKGQAIKTKNYEIKFYGLCYGNFMKRKVHISKTSENKK